MVHQIDLETGKIINTFNSLSAAGRSIGKDISNISICCRGITSTAYGYGWKFVEMKEV